MTCFSEARSGGLGGETQITQILVSMNDWQDSSKRETRTQSGLVEANKEVPGVADWHVCRHVKYCKYLLFTIQNQREHSFQGISRNCCIFQPQQGFLSWDRPLGRAVPPLVIGKQPMIARSLNSTARMHAGFSRCRTSRYSDRPIERLEGCYGATNITLYFYSVLRLVSSYKCDQLPTPLEYSVML